MEGFDGGELYIKCSHDILFVDDDDNARQPPEKHHPGRHNTALNTVVDALLNSARAFYVFSVLVPRRLADTEGRTYGAGVNESDT